MSADPKPLSSKRIRRDSIEREAAEQFKQRVIVLDRGCIIRNEDGGCSGILRAHHVIYQQHLRAHGLHDLLWETANGACLCDRHHTRHHSRVAPIHKSRIPGRCLKFIHDHGLGDLLDRYYA